MPQSPVRLLLLDDSESDATLVLRALRRAGLELEATWVSDGAAFAARLEEQPPDIVISDYQIPGFSGPAALALARARWPDVPLIIVSGAVGEAAAVETMRAGASDFVLKGELARLGPAVLRELQDAATRRERRRAEEALRHSEEQRRREAALLEETQALAGVAGWEADLATGAVRLTRQGYRILGVSPEAFTPSLAALAALPVPEDRARVEELVRRCVAGAPWDAEIGAVTPAGRRLQLRIIGSPVLEDGRVTGLRGAVLDVTERRRIEAQLLLADRLASMGTMAAGVAHEINNPLTYLLANLNELQEELSRASTEPAVAPLAAAARPLIADSIQGAERIWAIARDLKSFSRVEIDHPRPVDVGKVAASVVRMLRGEAAHRARVQVEVPADLSPVRADETKLAQLLTNLVLNALQAFQEAQRERNLVVLSAAEAGDGMVEIRVEDNGPGVPIELRERIFDPFFTTKQHGGGTGLGLSVCRTIAAQLGGTLSLESEVGRGTTFRLALPRGDSPGAQEDAAAPAPGVGRSDLRLLVVDDDLAVLRSLERVIFPCEVVAAAGAERALALLDGGERFDAVLCDVMMPGMSGIELYDVLRSRAPGLADRFLFMTGGAVTAAARAFVERLSPLRLLEKPFSAEALRQRLDALVGPGPGRGPPRGGAATRLGTGV